MEVVSYRTHQVRGHDSIDRLGLQDHAAGHSINKHLVDGDIGEVLGDAGGDLIPQHHPVALGVALRHHRQELAGPLPGGLEGKAHDALDAVAGEDGDLRGHLPRLAAVRSAALPRVLALAVLADDDPVQVPRLAVAQRRLRSLEHFRGPHVGVLLERLADCQTEAP